MKSVFLFLVVLFLGGNGIHANIQGENIADGFVVQLQNILRDSLTKVSQDERAGFNDTVDNLLAQLRSSIREGGLDPIRLASDSDTFTVNLYNQPLEGLFEISNVRVGGLSTVHRTGACSLNSVILTTRAVIDFGANDFLLGLDINLGVGIIRTNIQIEIVISHLSMLVDATLTTATGRLKLNDFRLNEIGTVRLNIKGIPMASKKISNILSTAFNSIKDSLTYAFQELLRPIIDSIITTPTFVDIFTN